MKTKLDIAKAKKAKRQEQTDDIKALVSEIKRFHDEFQPQEPIDLTELQKQLAELPVLIQQPLSSSLEGFLSAFKTHLVTTISKNKQDPDLSRLIKDIKIENKIDLKPLTKEIRNLREKAAKQSQNPEDFVPYRRVIKSGNKLVFDDNITAGGGGGGFNTDGLATTAKQDDIITAIGGISSGGAKPTDAYGIQAISEDATYKYFWFEDATPNYYIMRKNLSTSVFTYTKGNGSYTTVYVDSTSGPSGSPTWASYGTTF